MFCALLRSKDDLVFDELIQRITLPRADAGLEVNASLLVSGWGRMCSGGYSTRLLRAVEVPIVDQRVCEAAYSSVTDNMFCAGLMGEGGKDCECVFLEKKLNAFE